MPSRPPCAVALPSPSSRSSTKPVAEGFVPFLHVGGTFATGSEIGVASTEPDAGVAAGAVAPVGAAAGGAGSLAQAARHSVRRGRTRGALYVIMNRGPLVRRPASGKQAPSTTGISRGFAARLLVRHHAHASNAVRLGTPVRFSSSLYRCLEARPRWGILLHASVAEGADVRRRRANSAGGTPLSTAARDGVLGDPRCRRVVPRCAQRREGHRCVLQRRSRLARVRAFDREIRARRACRLDLLRAF